MKWPNNQRPFDPCVVSRFKRSAWSFIPFPYWTVTTSDHKSRFRDCKQRELITYCWKQTLTRQNSMSLLTED